MHLAMDTATSDIRALEFTPGSDGPVLPELLDQIPEGEEIGTVTARSHGLREPLPGNGCAASRPSGNASRRETPTDKPPRPRSAALS